MLNQLLKFTLISSLLLWLKPRWKGLLAVVIAVVLVHVFHGEYLSYVELSGDRSFLVWSYVIKWLALLLSVLMYIATVLYGPNARGQGAKPMRSINSAPADNGGRANDGFDFLREKKHLENRAEKIITRSKAGP